MPNDARRDTEQKKKIVQLWKEAVVVYLWQYYCILVGRRKTDEELQGGYRDTSIHIRHIVTHIQLPLIATPFRLIEVITYSKSSLLSLFGSIWTSSKSTGTPAYLTNNTDIITDPKLLTLWHTKLFLTFIIYFTQILQWFWATANFYMPGNATVTQWFWVYVCYITLYCCINCWGYGASDGKKSHGPLYINIPPHARKYQGQQLKLQPGNNPVQIWTRHLPNVGWVREMSSTITQLHVMGALRVTEPCFKSFWHLLPTSAG